MQGLRSNWHCSWLPVDRDTQLRLPLPEKDANLSWWPRLRGVRGFVSGLTVLAFMMWGASSGVGIILLVIGGR